METIPKNPAPPNPVDQPEPSFQVMPQEGRFQDLNVPHTASTTPSAPLPSTPKSPVATALPVEHEPSHRGSRIFYIVGGIVLLAILGVLGYYMLGSKKTSNQTTEQTVTTKLPKVWLKQYFDKDVCDDLKTCGDNADPDSDGLNNYDEFKAGSAPTNADTDSDGLADGDEVYIYKTEPTHKFTDRRDVVAQNNWTDGYQIKNGYDPLTPGLKFTDARLKQIQDDINRLGLHEPTKTTIGTKTTQTNSNSSNSSSNTQANTGQNEVTNQAVSIMNMAFSPATLTINKGDTVVWTNNDSLSHTVVADNASFSSQSLSNGAKFSFKFDTAGTFTYHCSIHPNMKATIIVK